MQKNIPIGTRNTGRPRSSESVRAICERLTTALGFNVTEQAVRWWIKKDYPLDDLNELRRRIIAQERLPEGCDINRLRADMRRPVLFGRHVREVVEGMPCRIIAEIRADPSQVFPILCEWVGYALKELCMHPDIPDGLLLTEQEAAEAAAYIEEVRQEKEAKASGGV